MKCLVEGPLLVGGLGPGPSASLNSGPSLVTFVDFLTLFLQFWLVLLCSRKTRPSAVVERPVRTTYPFTHAWSKKLDILRHTIERTF